MKINKPGKHSQTIEFNKIGESKNWLGIVDGRTPGEYELIIVAEHNVAETSGRIVVRAVVGAGASVKIRGRIKINKEAQKTNDFLEIRILLVDETARGVADPELEIEANEVVASHAASVGKIDPEQLIYLQSRGMSLERARDEIVEGWLRS